MGAGAEGGKHSGAVRATRAPQLQGHIKMIRSKLSRSRPHPAKRASCFARSALLACIALVAIGALAANAGDEKELLAPTGSLRVGVYPASPTSMVADPPTNQPHG